MMSRCIALFAALLATLFTTAAAHAQVDYPNRVVRIVNPYVAGSTTDVLARALAVGLSSRLSQQFVIENRPGAGGALGTAAVARAEADGHTLLFAPALVLSVYPQARGADTGYKPDALEPICQTFTNAMALAVRPDSPIKTIGDLVAMAKQRPGALNYGHQGPLTIPHLHQGRRAPSHSRAGWTCARGRRPGRTPSHGAPEARGAHCCWSEWRRF